MAKRKQLKHAIEALDVAKQLLRERIRNKDDLEEASKVTGMLWGQLLATALQQLGWTPTKFHNETGLAESAFRSWRDADHEPNPKDITILGNFWERQLKNIASVLEAKL